jgi:recombination protein RecA
MLLFINQIREKIGNPFGNPETTPGGRALKFYASVRLEVRRVESVKQNGEAVGNRVRTKVVKNKVAAPFRQAEFDIMFGRGISWAGSLLEAAVDHELVDRHGTWFNFKETRLGQGKEGAKSFLEQNPEVAQALQSALNERRLAAVN